MQLTGNPVDEHHGLHGLSSENEKSQLTTDEKFERFWNHHELMEIINVFEEDLKKD